jgi:hypothetical protein
MPQTYTRNEHYRCTRTSCKLVGYENVCLYSDNKPSITKGNHITPTRYSRSIRTWTPGTCKNFTYDSSGVYVSDYWTNVNHNQNFSEVVFDSLSGRNLSAELDRRFNDTVTNLSMMAKDLYDASNMALDYFKRVNRCWKDLKRRNFRKAFRAFSGSRRLSKGMANNWLAFQYGVLPTIHSVQDAFAAANNQKAQTLRLVNTVSGSRLAQCVSSKYWSIYGQQYKETSVRGFRYFTTKESISSLLVTNQAEVAWDATPYSFLLDWFVPIGDYLKQFGYSTNLRATTGCNSARSKENTYSGGSYLGSQGPLKTWSECRYSSISVTRTLNTSLVWRPSFSEVVNSSKVGLTTNRCANAFALLVQRIR